MSGASTRPGEEERAAADAVRADALAFGFDAVRVTSPDRLDPAIGARLDAFLADGRHGDMDWLATHAARRRHPSALWPEARSIVMLGASYAPGRDPLAVLAEPDRAAISVYAQGRDYHDVLKSRLKRIARLLAGRTGAEVKVFVDTAPLMEKPVAQSAGIGWQGKHTNLVSRTHGSWLFLGALMTTARLAPDPPETDHCGSCRRCLDVCPTAAFPAPYELDARRCLAYLTIEHKGHIPEPFRAPLGNRVFGCDDCLAVCPWNKFAVTARETRLTAREGTADPPLADLLALDDKAFRARFAGTPVKRTGRDRVVRNTLIAAGNSGDASLVPQVTALLSDNSPLVRAMAVWAFSRLVDRARVREIGAVALAEERDAAVRAEWAAACRPLTATEPA